MPVSVLTAVLAHNGEHLDDRTRDFEDFLNCMLDALLTSTGVAEFPLLDIVHVFGHCYSNTPDYIVCLLNYFQLSIVAEIHNLSSCKV